MMSTDSSTTRETGQRNQTDRPGGIFEQSSHERDPFMVPSILESFDLPPPPPSEDSKRVSKGNLPSTTNQGTAVTPGKTTADAGGSGKRGNFMVSVTVSDSSSSQTDSKVTSDKSITPPISLTNTASTVTTTTVTTATPTTESALLSKATNSDTTTTTFSQGRSPSSSFSRSQPLRVRPKMGLYQTTIGVNGHALPRGAGESRDAPRNPSALPLGASDSTVRHRERLIGPVTACVAPPPLRIADAQRERDRLTSVSQRLMSRPVKRKLWEVDHDKLGPEIEAEYKQMIEEDQKRFKERWVELGPDESPGAPSFYRSEVTPPRKRQTTAPSSEEAEASTSRPPLEEPVNTKGDKEAQQVSGALKSKPGSKAINADAEKKLPPPFQVDRKESNECPKDGSNPAKVPSGVSSKTLVEGQVSVKETLSRDDSPSAVSSSSSTPGVSSLKAASTKTTTISPLAKDMPSEGRTPRTRSMTSAREKTTHPHSPVTRSSRKTSLTSSLRLR